MIWTYPLQYADCLEALYEINALILRTTFCGFSQPPDYRGSWYEGGVGGVEGTGGGGGGGGGEEEEEEEEEMIINSLRSKMSRY